MAVKEASLFLLLVLLAVQVVVVHTEAVLVAVLAVIKHHSLETLEHTVLVLAVVQGVTDKERQVVVAVLAVLVKLLLSQ